MLNRYEFLCGNTPQHSVFAGPSLVGDWVKYEDAQAAIQSAVLAEREACAKVCESAETIEQRGGYKVVLIPSFEHSALIRARSQK